MHVFHPDSQKCFQLEVRQLPVLPKSGAGEDNSICRTVLKTATLPFSPPQTPFPPYPQSEALGWFALVTNFPFLESIR